MGKVDLSEFDEANRPPLQRLKVDVLLDELSEDRREACMAALLDIQYSAGAIARVLKSWGHEVSSDAINTWRRKQR
jgi:hypothetical protein